MVSESARLQRRRHSNGTSSAGGGSEIRRSSVMPATPPDYLVMLACSGASLDALTKSRETSMPHFMLKPCCRGCTGDSRGKAARLLLRLWRRRCDHNLRSTGCGIGCITRDDTWCLWGHIVGGDRRIAYDGGSDRGDEEVGQDTQRLQATVEQGQQQVARTNWSWEQTGQVTWVASQDPRSVIGDEPCEGFVARCRG
jgi:hypothetical protein